MKCPKSKVLVSHPGQHTVNTILTNALRADSASVCGAIILVLLWYSTT